MLSLLSLSARLSVCLSVCLFLLPKSGWLGHANYEELVWQIRLNIQRNFLRSGGIMTKKTNLKTPDSQSSMKAKCSVKRKCTNLKKSLIVPWSKHLKDKKDDQHKRKSQKTNWRDLRANEHFMTQRHTNRRIIAFDRSKRATSEKMPNRERVSQHFVNTKYWGDINTNVNETELNRKNRWYHQLPRARWFRASKASARPLQKHSAFLWSCQDFHEANWL